MREVFKAFLITRTAAALSAALLFGGCGGGSNIVTPTPGTPTPGFTEVEPALTADNLRLFGELDTSVGASVGFVVLSNDSQSLDTIDWQQTRAQRLIYWQPIPRPLALISRPPAAMNLR